MPAIRWDARSRPQSARDRQGRRVQNGGIGAVGQRTVERFVIEEVSLGDGGGPPPSGPHCCGHTPTVQVARVRRHSGGFRFAACKSTKKGGGQGVGGPSVGVGGAGGWVPAAWSSGATLSAARRNKGGEERAVCAPGRTLTVRSKCPPDWPCTKRYEVALSARSRGQRLASPASAQPTGAEDAVLFYGAP